MGDVDPVVQAPTIVLAGGESRRMGTDKLCLDIDGVPMLQRTIDRLAGPVLLVLDPRRAAGPLPVHRRGIRSVVDTRPGAGPLAALEAGLDACVDAPITLVVAGDMPWLDPGVLVLLVTRLADAPDRDVVCLADTDGPRPLPLAIRPARVLPRLTALLDAGERRLRALLADATVIGPAAWHAIDPRGDTLRDVDTPADLVIRA